MDTYKDTDITSQADVQHFIREVDCSSVVGSFGECEFLSAQNFTKLKHESVTLNDDAVQQDANNSYEKLSKMDSGDLITWAVERHSIIDKLADQQYANKSYEKLSKMGSGDLITWAVERHSIIDELADQQYATNHSTATNESLEILSNNHNISTGVASLSVVSAEQIESKAVVSGQTTKGMLANETKDISTCGVEFSLDDSAKEHVMKSMNKDHENLFTTVDPQGSNVTFIGFQIDQQASRIKANDGPELGPELAKFFSNAKHTVEIEEQHDIPNTIQSPTKKKPVKESFHSLRMLLFAEETAVLAKKDEKQKIECRVLDFSNKVVPASDNEEDFKLSTVQEVIVNGEASNGFSEPLAFSGALLSPRMISFSEPMAYSGSISHGSDSSTSTRSFAFPILASEWNFSPVKMGAPDLCFVRQRSKRNFSFCCCRRPSTMFE